jgi:hypothetical protein
VGGDGQGPGEYGSISLFGHFTPDSIGVWDSEQDRGTVLALDGTFARTFRGVGADDRFVYMRGFPGDGSVLGMVDMGIRPDTFPEGLHSSTSLFVTVGRGGVDTVGVFETGEFLITSSGGNPGVTTPPLARRGVQAAGIGRVFQGDGRTFEIREYTPAGDLVRSIRYLAPPRTLAREVIERWVERAGERYEDPREARQAMDRARAQPFPATLPPYSELRVDTEGNLWVGEYRLPWETEPAWHVFDPTGRLLGRVVTPTDFTIFEIGENYLLGAHRDELGVEYVRLLDLERGMP